MVLKGCLIFCGGVPALFVFVLFKARNVDVHRKVKLCSIFPSLMDRLLEAARYDAELRGYFIKKRMDDKEALDAIRHYLQLVNMRSYRVVTRLGFIYSAYTEQVMF